MRKKLLFGACAALFLDAGIITAIRASQANRASDMLLANAEALALGEMIGDEYCDTGYWGDICAIVFDAKGQSFKLFHYKPQP